MKEVIFHFAHLQWCHNEWAFNILIVVDNGSASTTQSIGCPSNAFNMAPSKMGKTTSRTFYYLIRNKGVRNHVTKIIRLLYLEPKHPVGV